MTVEENGTFTDPTFFGLALSNPAAEQYYRSNKYKNGTQLLGNLFADINILKDLKFRTNFGYFVEDKKEREILPEYQVSASQINKQNSLGILREGNINWIWEQTLNYLKEWKDQSLGILLGYTAEQRKFEKTGAGRLSFPGVSDELYYLT